MIIDIEKCIGCGNCVRACSVENNVPDSCRTWVERYFIADWKGEEAENPVVDSPDGAKEGFPEIQREGKSFFVPKLCNHCADSPCTQVCPVGATFISPDGVVLVDQTYCVGCRYCIQACPYGCRFLNPETNTAQKCTLCYHRITKGLTTACCEACPTAARQLADLKNPKDPTPRIPSGRIAYKYSNPRWRPAPRSSITAWTDRFAREESLPGEIHAISHTRRARFHVPQW